MQIILTHDQADFDALAAMLGAHLLNEQAIPVLPHRMNRNLRAFLNLYGSELPFVEPGDLPDEPIESVTLVDTQSLVTLKGLNQHTDVNVVDHHPRRTDLPAHWTILQESLGATTTLFVESLREHNGALNFIHATLLLLGIYEDTGSLTYASTTARDAQAVAFLLEQGASLRIANEYLNPPLSPEQRELQDQFLASAQTHLINSQHIIIAKANAEKMTEEISSVAHKLRDLLDPDALFLLASTIEGIRIVARSTNDQINVAEILAQFGGGGHDRAASALIRLGGKTNIKAQRLQMDELCQKLIEMLPQHVQPTISVGQIMSRRPRTLTLQTSAQEAAELMKRYGYEGYPVVEQGNVVGLLTRRAVDRAIAHKLNLTASSLMEVGENTVHPQDAIEHVQSIMANTGWGQVPVTDPESGKIIGIVTRTDVLKTLSGSNAPLPGKRNLIAQLEAVLSPARLAFLKLIAASAHEEHLPLYIVGGFVRDLILEQPSLDFDMVVEGDAIALARALSERYGGTVVSHSRFGTAKWQIGTIRSKLVKTMESGSTLNPRDLPESLDLISARTEFYDHPTALPTVERSSIKLDLHRRDFTINTMALRLDGHHYGDLYDYWGGLDDLHNHLVRVLHSLSFVDDPTRLLRAIRFEQRFHFQIEPRTRELMEQASPLLKQVTGSRLRHELDLMLEEQQAVDILARLSQLDLLSAIHPDLGWSADLRKPLKATLHSKPGKAWELPESYANWPTHRVLAYLVWLGQMPVASALKIAERLRFPTLIQDALKETCRLWVDLPGLVGQPASAITQRLEEAPIMSVYAISALNADPAAKKIIVEFVTHWRKVKPETTGKSLVALGVPTGPRYKDLLKQLRAAWLNGVITSTEEENAYLQQAIANGSIYGNTDRP
ncbi:MAG: CBS domain-containing protein, partial [Anaerolineaceae bacterium]